MKKLLLCVISSLAISAFAEEIWGAEKNQKRADIRWTRVLCEEHGRYIGWPSIALLKSGDLMVVFSGDRDFHVCPWGRVQMIRSTDGGETWSAPVAIGNTPLDDRDAGIVQLPDGEILVSWFTSQAYRDKKFLTTDYPPGKPQFYWKLHDNKIASETRKQWMGIFGVRSRDNGKTWSAPERLPLRGSTPHGPILLKDGSLFQAGRYHKAGATYICAERSTDGGKNWQMLNEALEDGDANPGKPNSLYHEPFPLELPDGTLLMQIRCHAADNLMRQSVSKDGGKTWTPMTKIPCAGLPPHLIQLRDGKVVTVYGRRFNDFGEYACISDDNGKTWDAANEIRLCANFNGDLGYPASVQLPDGDILTIYYQPPAKGKKPALMGTRWRAK